jgi:hypothetical protein
MPEDPETQRLRFSPRDLQTMIAKGRHLGLTDHALATELQLTGEELSRIERGTDRRWLNELLAEWQERIRPRTPADMRSTLLEAAEASHAERDRARAEDEGAP